MLSLKRLIACVSVAVLLAGTFSFMPLIPAQATSYTTVDSVDPADGDDDVAVDKVIKVKFDDTMTRSDVEDEDYVTLTKRNSSGNIRVDLSYSSGNRTLTVTPRSDLDYDTKYELMISRKVENTDGDPLQRDYYADFTTEEKGSTSNYIDDRSPDDGDTGVSLDTAVKVTFKTDMYAKTINNDTFYLKEDGSSSRISTDVTYNKSSRVATLQPNSSLDSNTKYRVYLDSDIETDDSDNIKSEDWQFKTGSSSDSGVTSSDPRSNASNVSTGTDVRATFLSSLKESSITSGGIVFRNTTDGKDVSFDVSLSGSKTIIVKPKDTLSKNCDYSVKFTSNIKEYDGYSIDEYTLKFSTGSSASSSSDTKYISSRDPDNNDTDVKVNTDIVVKFDRDMDESTMKESNIVLKETDRGTEVNTTVDYSDSKRILTITPRSSLKDNTDYTIILEDSIRDDDGDRIDNEIKWYFSTKKGSTTSTSSTPSTVFANDMTPKSGATGVSLTAALKVVFSGALDPSTLTGDSVKLQKAATSEVVTTGREYKTTDNSINLYLLQPLASNTVYNVIINGLKDSTGKSVSFLQYSFTTGSSSTGNTGTSTGGTGTTGTVTRQGTMYNPLLTFNGNYVNMVDAQPYIKNKRTMVPMRALFEMVGATVVWDNATQKIAGTLSGKQVIMYAGKNIGYINGKAVQLDAPPELIGDRAMIPLRFATESLGLQVGYDAKNYIVQLSQ